MIARTQPRICSALGMAPLDRGGRGGEEGRMTGRDEKKQAAKARAERLAQALRANLRRRKAQALADQGIPVSLFMFSPTMLFHQRRFHPDGVWIQTGGLAGRSGRTGHLVQMTRFSTRLKKEITRVGESF